MLLKPIEIMAINMGNSRLGQIVIIILIAYILGISDTLGIFFEIIKIASRYDF